MTVGTRLSLAHQSDSLRRTILGCVGASKRPAPVDAVAVALGTSLCLLRLDAADATTLFSDAQGTKPAAVGNQIL